VARSFVPRATRWAGARAKLSSSVQILAIFPENARAELADE
jgi:hypothetical protein